MIPKPMRGSKHLFGGCCGWDSHACGAEKRGEKIVFSRISRTFRQSPWLTFGFGVIVSIEAAIIGPHIFLFLFSLARDPSYKHLTTLLALWQSLTAGIIALGAAIIAALVVYYQTENTNRLENERKSGEIASRQATLLFAMPLLGSYAKECAIRQADIMHSLDQGKAPPQMLKIPSIPLEPVNAIPPLIALYNRADGRKYLELLLKVRSQNINYERSILQYPDQLESPGTIFHLNALIDAIKIHASALSVQAHLASDRRVPIEPLGILPMITSADQCLQGHGYLPSVLQIIQQRYV